MKTNPISQQTHTLSKSDKRWSSSRIIQKEREKFCEDECLQSSMSTVISQIKKTSTRQNIFLFMVICNLCSTICYKIDWKEKAKSFPSSCLAIVKICLHIQRCLWQMWLIRCQLQSAWNGTPTPTLDPTKWELLPAWPDQAAVLPSIRSLSVKMQGNTHMKACHA